MTESIETIGELIVVEHTTLPILFAEGKADSLVDEIEKKVRSFVPVIETAKGRKDIASLAYKIARSKNMLDDAGKQLTADWKSKAKLVDQERSKIWARLESLQNEIRSPLTEYESKENERKGRHHANLGMFKNILTVAIVVNAGDISSIERGIEETEGLLKSRDWEEFNEQANELHEKTILILKEKLSTKKAEIEIQKREEAERQLKEEQEKREREERIAREAAEKALRIAEEKARLAAEEEAAKVKAQQEKELREKQRIEQEKQESEERAIKAEKDRLEAIEHAKAEKLAMEEKAKRDIEEAIWRERERVEEEKQKQEQETEKQEEDKCEKMKVYIVTKYVTNFFDGTTYNIAVFLSENGALNFIDNSPDDYDSFHIEEHEVI